ncbi:MAG: ABC transporter permease subunit [bacterium]|nr:ABC transporter permease subunit [bacterium]MCM1374819.1 ABC transporter permease subunit [Muribaculum sp.]
MKAFMKKEWMELCRTGRLLVLLLVFTLFGIMNPATAKLTPWLMEVLSESLADAGLVTEAVTVDAMTSWAQFYKNIPVALISFVLICSGSFTAEYQRGTLVPVITRGLPRQKIVLAKALMIFSSWTAVYWLCFGITYGYNAYFWDNGIAQHPFLAAALTWLFGIWVIALLVCLSAVAQSSTQVLAGVGGIVMAVYMGSMFPKLGRYLPIKLMDGMSLLHGVSLSENYDVSIAVTGLTILLCMGLATVFFKRKQL